MPKSWRLTWSTSIRAARRLPVSPVRPIRLSRSRWRRASPTTRHATSWRLSPTSRQTWRRPSPWTACCAATWVSARPRSPCAQPLSAWTPAARSWCSAPRPFWPNSTTRHSLSVLPRLAWRSRYSAASARRRSKSARSRRLPRARLMCSSARTVCFRPT